MKWTTTIAATAIMLTGLPAAAQDVVLRLGSIVAPATTQAQAMDRFAQIAKDKKVGLDIRTFHGSQLGTGPEQVRNVQLGVQDMFMDGMVFWSDFSEDMRIAETPFSFASRQHFERWVNSPSFGKIQQDIIAKGSQRLINLEVPWRRGPFRVLVAKRPVRNLEEFGTLKLRLWQSEVANRFYGKQGLGATPINLALGDAYLAIRQGLAEAITLPFDLVLGMKFHEVAPHIVLVDEFWQVLPMSIGERKWQSLKEAQRKALTDAVGEAGRWYNAELEKSVEEWKKAIAAAGGQFHEIDRRPFVQRIAERNKQWQAEGYWRKGLIDEIEALKP